ncbi:MAG: prenyltransferase/squalene oxidase repeat-containing protein [Planctomycetota bacterium]
MNLRSRLVSPLFPLALAATLHAQSAAPAAPAAPQAPALSAARSKGLAWLLQQQKDGVFVVNMRGREMRDPGLSAFGLMALQTKPKELRTAHEQKVVDQGIAWLLTQQNEDGTFGQRQPNYVTCVAVGALTRAGNPAHEPVLKKAQRSILVFQHLESSGYSPSDPDYGSIGYDSKSRGDLSNLHFSLEALRATGLPQDHEALQKALVFLQRTQNLKSVNDHRAKTDGSVEGGEKGPPVEAVAGDDGGAVYFPGNSPAGYLKNPDGTVVPRSYGSMTYALLKAYTLAGVKKDDPRVQAAVRWIGEHWDLTGNPGNYDPKDEKAKFHGQFYGYVLLAQALDAAGLDEVATKDKDGKTVMVAWRPALRQQLESMQQADGSWVNQGSDRFFENVPLLCTSYALVALELCRN